MPDKKSKSKHSAENDQEGLGENEHHQEHTKFDYDTPAPEEALESDNRSSEADKIIGSPTEGGTTHNREPETVRPHFQVVEETEGQPEEERSKEPLNTKDASAVEPKPQRSYMTNPYQTSGFTAEENTMSDPNPNQSAQHDFRFNREPQRKFPWWIVIIVLVLALIGAGVWKFFLSSPPQSENQPSVTDILIEPPATSTASPSPEPQKELKREDIKVQVLNGSGVVGSAGELASALESAGFENVDIDNADNYDYTGIVIQVKEGEDERAKLIESDLEDDYEDIEIEDTLDEDSEFDAVVIRGSQPGDEDVLGAQDETSETTDSDTDETSEATDSGSNE